MATFLQFAQSKKPVPPVSLIAGTTAGFVRIALDDALRRLGTSPDCIRRMFGDESPVRQVMIELAKPTIFPGRTEVVVFGNAEQADNLKMLMAYVERPTPDKHLIITSSQVRVDGRGSERLLPSDDRILYVDCGRVNTGHLIKYAIRCGLSDADADWLIARSGGDCDEVCRNLDLLDIFPYPWPEGFVTTIFSPFAKSMVRFSEYAVLDSDNDLGLCIQLKERLFTIIKLSQFAQSRMTVPDMIMQADIDNWMFTKVFGLAKSKPPEVWLERLAMVVQAEGYVRQGMEGVREWLLPRL